MFKAVVSYLHLGVAGFLLLFLLLCAIYFAWKMCVLLADAFLEKNSKGVQQCRQLLVSLLYVILVSGVLFAIVGFSLEYVDTRSMDPEHIMAVNHALMRADYALFGVYPPLWLQDSHNTLKPFLDAASPILVGVYRSITLTLSLVFLLLLLFRQDLFLDMFVAFMLCLFIALPFWFFFPSLSPIESFYVPLFDIPIAESIRTALQTYQPNAHVADYIQKDAEYVHSIKDSLLQVTTMPSMHGAWIAIAAYFVSLVWRPLALIAIPYFLINAVSTLYVMQHYAVDQIAAVFVAVPSIIIVRRLHLKPGRHLSFLFEIVEKDVEGLKREMRSLCTKQ